MSYFVFEKKTKKILSKREIKFGLNKYFPLKPRNLELLN